MLGIFQNWLKRLKRKKFKIEEQSFNPQSLTGNQSPTRSGNFFIIDEHTIPTSNEPILGPGGFSVLAKTRPKQCPLCRTENKVTRLSSKQWQCNECKHIWE